MSHANPDLTVLLDPLAATVTAVAKDSFLEQTTRRPAIVSINQHLYYFVHLDHEINACLKDGQMAKTKKRSSLSFPVVLCPLSNSPSLRIQTNRVECHCTLGTHAKVIEVCCDITSVVLSALNIP